MEANTKLIRILRRLLSNPFDLFLLYVGMIGSLIVLFDFLTRSRQQTIPYEPVILIALSLLILSRFFDRLRPSSEDLRPTPQPDNLNTRLATLTQALADAGRVIVAMETEIQSRQQLVKELETQKSIAEQAITLSKEQVDAVSAILSKQVSKQSNIDRRHQRAREFGFFIAGVIAQIVITWLFTMK